MNYLGCNTCYQLEFYYSRLISNQCFTWNNTDRLLRKK